MPGKRIARVLMLFVGLIGSGGLLLLAIMVHQGRRAPTARPAYVALGSSYAAGYGLGDRAAGSPFACMRGEGGYPRLVARKLALSLVDKSCSGATAPHVLLGGQYFQGPQISAITRDTRLVTLTAGGNDLFYVGDLLGLAKRKQGGIVGWAARVFLQAPHDDAERDADRLRGNFRAIIETVRSTAPAVVLVITTYPPILPDQGSCPALGLTVREAAMMRAVAAKLAEATRSAASGTGVVLVDMATLGSGHDACSTVPWVNGANAKPGDGGAFHPTRLGAAATANAIAKAVRGLRTDRGFQTAAGDVLAIQSHRRRLQSSRGR